MKVLLTSATLLAAMNPALYEASFKDVEVVVCTDGVCVDGWMSEVLSLGICDNVQFAEFVDRDDPVFNWLWLVDEMSRYERSGLALRMGPSHTNSAASRPSAGCWDLSAWLAMPTRPYSAAAPSTLAD